MITIKIDGMSCAHCSAAVKEALARVTGVETIHSVSHEQGQAQISGTASTASLIAAIEEAGYSASVET